MLTLTLECMQPVTVHRGAVAIVVRADRRSGGRVAIGIEATKDWRISRGHPAGNLTPPKFPRSAICDRLRGILDRLAEVEGSGARDRDRIDAIWRELVRLAAEVGPPATTTGDGGEAP